MTALQKLQQVRQCVTDPTLAAELDAKIAKLRVIQASNNRARKLLLNEFSTGTQDSADILSTLSSFGSSLSKISTALSP